MRRETGVCHVASSLAGVVLMSGCLMSTCVTAGCGRRPPAASEATMRIEDVPPELMKIAREQLPGVKFDTVWRKPNGTLEIRGKTKTGKIREVELGPDGSVEEIE